MYNCCLSFQKFHQPVNLPQQELELKSNNLNMFNPALYNPNMAQVVAEHQSRFYNQYIRTMAIGKLTFL